MNCPVCLSARTAPRFAVTNRVFEASRAWHLAGCEDCGTMFLDPMPGAGEIAAFYTQGYWWKPGEGGALGRAENLYRRLVLRLDHVSFVLGTIRRLHRPKEEMHILDIGCGSATLLAGLKSRGFRVMGVDLSGEAAKIAESAYGIHVAVGSLEAAALPANSFGLVTLFNVLEHVPDPRPLLAEVARILSPGGKIVVQVPNTSSLQARLFGAGWHGLDVPRHVIDFSLDSMKTLLSSCGFIPERVRHFSLRDSPAALASSLAPRLDTIGRAVRAASGSSGRREHALAAWARHLAYLLLVAGSVPFALAEAVLGRGAMVIIEARRAE